MNQKIYWNHKSFAPDLQYFISLIIFNRSEEKETKTEQFLKQFSFPNSVLLLNFTALLCLNINSNEYKYKSTQLIIMNDFLSSVFRDVSKDD